jgi:type I restriction enzyme M protein
LAYKDLEDFVACYNPKNRHERKENDRFKAYTYNELMQRDKANLDIFWLKDESLEDTDNLPAPEILAAEIAENLESALEQFNSITEELKENKESNKLQMT